MCRPHLRCSSPAWLRQCLSRHPCWSCASCNACACADPRAFRTQRTGPHLLLLVRYYCCSCAAARRKPQLRFCLHAARAPAPSTPSTTVLDLQFRFLRAAFVVSPHLVPRHLPASTASPYMHHLVLRLQALAVGPPRLLAPPLPPHLVFPLPLPAFAAQKPRNTIDCCTRRPRLLARPVAPPRPPLLALPPPPPALPALPRHPPRQVRPMLQKGLHIHPVLMKM